MQSTTIGFIGGGNMAVSLIGGLLNDGYAADRIIVAEPSAEGRERLRGKFAVATTAQNNELVERADVVVLAVKPQVMQEVCTGIAAQVATRHPLLVSIAAGVRCADILRWLDSPKPLALIRTMPNTPALVGCGATALYATAQVTSSQRELAEGLLRAAGLTLWVGEETQLDAVTAVSGSGPAYYFLLMEIMEEIGTHMGLPAETARLLTLQTAFGAAKMALESTDDAATLRHKVTSPGGTTERAIGILEEGKVRELFTKALEGARLRAGELGDLLGGR